MSNPTQTVRTHTSATPNGLRRALYAALLVAAAAPAARPCTNTPATVVASIDTTQVVEVAPGRWNVDVRMQGYTIFGGNPGQFCTCAFAVPDDAKAIQKVLSASMVYSGTEVAYPGFEAFADDPESTLSWQNSFTGSGAFGFSAAVVDVLAPGVPVDLIFRLRMRTNKANPTGQLPYGYEPSMEETLVELCEDLMESSLGTDEANPDGSTAGTHGGIASVARVSVFSSEGTWQDLGDALAGVQGEPLLAGFGTLEAGDLTTVSVSQAVPDGSSNLVIGISDLGAAFKGGVLVPSPDVVLPGLPLDAEGYLSISFPWPAGLPSQTSLWWQHWIPDTAGPLGWSASNGLRSTTP